MINRLMCALFALLFASSLAVAQNVTLSGNIALGAGSATASAGAATVNNKSATITSEALSTAAGAIYTLTVSDSVTANTDLCFASVFYGSSTTGSPAVTRITPGNGNLVIIVQNVHASAALNGTIIVPFVCFKA